MEPKRKISILIPYKIKDGKILVYLQKRAKDAKRLPNRFGFFGGGAEGNETKEETLVREIKEELNFFPEGFVHFGKYETERSLKDIFTLKVEDDFDSKITVLEGQYGKWFEIDQAIQEPELIENDKLILTDFSALRSND